MEQEQRPGRLVICGDSFNIGIGCDNLLTEPYGVLLSNKLGLEQINLAKGSSTNLSIWLQVQWAVDNLNLTDNDIVIVVETSHERIEWFPDNAIIHWPIDNLDVNYHDYPPYGHATYHQVIPDYMSNKQGYNGGMLTENMRGIVDYLDNYVARGDKQENGYYKRLSTEPVAKLKIIKDYYLSVHQDRLSIVRSQAMMSMSHLLLRNAGVKHIITSQHQDIYKKVIANENLMYFDWFAMATKYPDKIPSGHADYRGHIEACELFHNKIKENGWA